MRKLAFLLVPALLFFSCASEPAPAPSGSCRLTAVNPVTIYSRASAAAEVFGTLGASQSVFAMVRTANGFYGFDPGVAQAGNIGLFRMRWVLKTVDLATEPGGADLPTVVPPIDGICYAMIMTDIYVHASPDEASAVLITLHMNDYAMVTSRASGWCTLDLNVGTAGLDSLGYLRESDIGGFNGPCDGL